MIKRSIDASLVRYRTLIMNASRHPKVKEAMELYGYDEGRLRAGSEILAAFILWQQEKENCYSQQRALSQQLKEDMKALKAVYAKHLEIARFAFREDPFMQSQLQLKGSRKSNWAGWSQQVHSFYVRIEEGIAPMKKFGARADELEQAKAMADALFDTYQQRLSHSGNAQSATQKRNEAFKRLNKWVADYSKVARVALQEDPQLLEVLGILVPSEA